MATKIIYVRLTEELHKRLEEVMSDVPGEKSTVARFLLEKAIGEYERRKALGEAAWFAEAGVAAM